MTEFPGWPEPSYVQTNGIRMAVYEAGPLSVRPPIVFSHGFPELAFSWRHQLKDLSEAGFRVLAPDQRGYGLTDAPGEVAAYDLDNLTADLVGVLDARGIDKAVFCGHDWGGGVVWAMGKRHPDRVAGIIGVNTPFQPRRSEEPIRQLREQMGDQMYIVHFQKPSEADEILDEDVNRTLSFMYRRPAHTTNDSKGVLDSKSTNGKSAFNVAEAVRTYDAGADPREEFLTPAEKDFFVRTFQRTGFTGGINWYRNLTRNWEADARFPDKVTAPSLMICAELDRSLPPSAAEGMERYVPNLRMHLIKGSGHWTQQEKPEEVTRVIAKWMHDTFPQACSEQQLFEAELRP